MADLVKLNTANSNAQAVKSACDQIAQGISTLERLNGLRANAIGVNAAEVASVFGVSDSTQAQILSDRWGAIMAWWNSETVWISTAAEARTALKDLIDAMTWAA